MDNINIDDLIDVNLYEILNVNIDSNETEIKKQYKKLILKYLQIKTQIMKMYLN
jgi:preprotein translocase subunit Sec63